MAPLPEGEGRIWPMITVSFLTPLPLGSPLILGQSKYWQFLEKSGIGRT
jgi:hypothetical protein